MYENILMPVDGSEASERGVDEGLRLAREMHANVHALYVVELKVLAPLEITTESVVAALEEEGRKATADVVSRAEEMDLTATAAVVRGTVHEAILDYADEHDVDLVVMSTRGRTGLDRQLLGSVTERVVRLSDVPVLTVRKPPE